MNATAQNDLERFINRDTFNGDYSGLRRCINEGADVNRHACGVYPV